MRRENDGNEKIRWSGKRTHKGIRIWSHIDRRHAINVNSDNYKHMLHFKLHRYSNFISGKREEARLERDVCIQKLVQRKGY